MTLIDAGIKHSSKFNLPVEKVEGYQIFNFIPNYKLHMRWEDFCA